MSVDLLGGPIIIYRSRAAWRGRLAGAPRARPARGLSYVYGSSAAQPAGSQQVRSQLAAMGVLFLQFVLLVAGQVGARHPVPPQPAEDVVAAGTALLQRVLPSTHAGQFVVEAIPCDAATGREVLEYDASAATATSTAKVTLRGCTGVAVASALHWYLKEEVSGGYSAPSWASLPPVRGLPTTLPVPKAKRRLVRPVRFSWYTNVCTPSYSFAWWDWARCEYSVCRAGPGSPSADCHACPSSHWPRASACWSHCSRMWWCVTGEQEIDLMAMHGVNIMYAHTGAEHVQAKVWTDLLGANATRGIDDFYTGPGEEAYCTPPLLHIDRVLGQSQYLAPNVHVLCLSVCLSVYLSVSVCCCRLLGRACLHV